MYTLLRYTFYRLSLISKVGAIDLLFRINNTMQCYLHRYHPYFPLVPQRVDISRVTLPFTSIISDGIIVITFNVTIADDTIITVITTGAPVRPPIIVFYLPCLKSSFQGRNKLPVPVSGHRYNATVTS